MVLAAKPARRSGRKTTGAPATGSTRVGLYLGVFYILFTAPLLLLHISLLDLPFFWDEHGQFIPTALEIFRRGHWVPHLTLPNIHPPGVEAYLVLWYKAFGYSVPITRTAMLLLAGLGLLLVFLLTIELSRNVRGVPAFIPPVLLAVSPLFFMQSMMAQLDMPAMVFTLLTLLLYLKGRIAESALAGVALVLAKETGLVTPAVLFVLVARQRRYRQAAYYLAAPAVLAMWLLYLHRKTGYWAGNPGFEQYNVTYALHPARLLLNVLRRLYYLFFAEFRFIGTIAIALVWRQLWALRSSDWGATGLVFAANLTIVTIFGGADLERYLLPVLPLLYIVMALATMMFSRALRTTTLALLIAGLLLNLRWNPPYPFPFENNWAMVDFVQLQAEAARYISTEMPGVRLATAWPYSAALNNPDYGYVRRPQQTVNLPDFQLASVRAIPPQRYNALVVYTRTWAPENGVTSIGLVREFLTRFYDYEDPIDAGECAKLGLFPAMSWRQHGQTLTIYTRSGPKSIP